MEPTKLNGAKGDSRDVFGVYAGDGGQALICKCPNPRCGGGVVLFIKQPDHKMQSAHFSAAHAGVLLDHLVSAEHMAESKTETEGVRMAFDEEADSATTLTLHRHPARHDGVDVLATRVTIFRHYGDQMFHATALFLDQQIARVITSLRIVLYGKAAKA